jgi:multidrug resistance efflux pump
MSLCRLNKIKRKFVDKVYTINELKESSLIYNRRTPLSCTVITLITLIFLISAVIWAGVSVKTYIVKANGIITTENKVNIMNKVSGAIKTLNASEGQTVKSGDILFEINSFQIEIQIQQIQASIEYYELKLAAIKRLFVFINGLNLTTKTAKLTHLIKIILTR